MTGKQTTKRSSAKKAGTASQAKNQTASKAKSSAKDSNKDSNKASKEQSTRKVTKTSENAKAKANTNTKEQKTGAETQPSRSTAAAKKAKAEVTASHPEVTSVTERRSGNGIAWLAVLLGLGGLGLAGYTYMNTQIASGKNEGAMTRLDDFRTQASELRQSNDNVQGSISDLKGEIVGLSGRVDSMDSKFTDIDSTISNVRQELSDSVTDVSAHVATLETGVDEKFSNQVAELEANYGRIASAMSQFELKEIESMIALAQERLILAADVESAGRALKVADAKLAGLDNTSLLSLRQQVQSSIAELEQTKTFNVADLATRLAGAVQSVDSLPLAEMGRLQPSVAAANDQTEAASEEATTVATEVSSSTEASDVASGEWWKSVDGVLGAAGSAAKKAGGAIASSLDDVVVVHDVSETATPLMEPQQRFFLKENLRMAIQNSEYGLIRGYESAAKTNAQSARKMLGQYFVGDNGQVQELDALLEEVESISLEVEIPDLSATLDAVRSAANQSSGQ